MKKPNPSVETYSYGYRWEEVREHIFRRWGDQNNAEQALRLKNNYRSALERIGFSLD